MIYELLYRCKRSQCNNSAVIPSRSRFCKEHSSIIFRSLYNVTHYLASLKLPSTARWAQHGVTVAGAANGTRGSSLDRLHENYGVFCADNDILYIADIRNDRIVLIAPNSTTAIRIIGGSAQLNMFKTPCDVFVTRRSIYVMDTWNFRVQKWARNFFSPYTVAGITDVNGSSTDMTKLSNAHHFFVDTYDNVFVGDYSNHRVMRFPWNSTSGTSGVIVAGTGVAGSAPSQLRGPMGVFLTDDGILFVADCKNHRIQKWTIGESSGITVAGTGSPGTGLSELNFPTKVLIDLNGYMYIADFGNNRVVRWAPGASVGECIVACSGYRGVGTDQLNAPSSITFDSHGSLYVNDRDNNRVQKFQILRETSILLAARLFLIESSFCLDQTTASLLNTEIETKVSTTSKLKIMDEPALYF